MADTEVQNDINEIIIDFDGPESEKKVLNSNSVIIQQSILSDDGPKSIINISNSNDVISETIFFDDRPQNARLNSKADPEIQNEIIFNMIGDGSESDTNISNSNDNIISESILIDDGSQSITNILNSNEYIISKTILSDDQPQSVINNLNSENDVSSKTILNVDRPENVTNTLNSNNNDIFETIRNDDRAQSVTNIHNDDRPANFANMLNTYNDIISETILSDDRPQNLANHLELNDDAICENVLNDDRLKNVTGILNTNEDVISETILSDDRPQNVTIVINSNDSNISETILNNDRPQSVTNVLNLNETVSETNLNNDRSTNITNILNINDDVISENILSGISPQNVMNLLCSNDSSISETIENNDGSQSITNIFNSNNDHTTEMSNLNTNESMLSSHFNEDSLNKTEVNVLPLSNQSSICEHYENYKIGDIVWAKIGKYPFWPGIICSDPESNIHYRNKKKIWFHVRFCNDKGRRSWIKTLISYCGKDELLTKYPNCLSSLRNSGKLMDTWSLAVKEADHLLELDREIRLEEFFKTFFTLDNLGSETSSSLNNCSDGTDLAIKVRTYTRKRSLTVPEQDSKKIKTENISVNGLKGKEEIIEKKKPTKTYPPKNAFTHNYDLSGSMETSSECNGDNSLLSDNYNKFTDSNMSLTPSAHGLRKRKISSKCEKEICSVNNVKNNILTLLSLSLSNSKKTETKNKRYKNESSTGRKSITTKSESSPEPDTTESEASSKNETYSSVFLASTKNKQLFVKNLKRACVVCKSIENTVKCIGPCQSYFHVECLTKSEERYHKSEPKIVIKNKKSSRRKRSYKEQVLNLKRKSITNPTPDDYCDLSKDKNNILTLNEDTERLSEIQIANKDSVREISGEKIIDTPLKSLINGKISKDDSKYMCSLCKANKTNCFVCGLVIEDHGEKIMCKMNSCGKYYHEKCLRDWPQCQWFQGLRNNIRCVVCPHHVCHLCISDNPKSSCKTHFPGEKLARCIKCPTAYHRSEYCLPAGSKVLTYFDIICSRHFEPFKPQNHHFNAPWCFICTLGGTLVCCDLCPSSFHIECLNQNPSEFEEGFTCEECQTGRYPLYGEIVWVKIGNYRWWPAQIIFPNQVPDSVNAIPHSVGQFAVRFFGSYDYYWVNRGRVFNFHEGDDENILKKSKMKVIDQVFQNAIIEAAQAHNAYILDKDKNDAILAKKTLTRPPKFMRIKFNRPIGNVKNIECDSTTMTPCECDPFKPNPCGPGSDCINRMLMFECHPQLCPAGDKCNNQRFEKTLYPDMVPFLTKGRGWGLKTLEDIKEGSFIIEYVGDVIDEEEYQRRCLEMHQRNEQNYYFLTIDNSRMIDAGPKGNLSRFMNHSCEPNCVTQKWTVNGDTRIGLFALHDIPSGTELVFDYRLQSCSGVEKKPCQCGATRCSKFIGVKVEEEKKKLISINDADKCKTATKYKRKPLKLKDNVSDSNKSKLSKVSKNEQNVPVTENEVYISNVEKTYDSKKAKTKVTNGRKSTILKNENLEASEKLSVKKKWKNVKKDSTKMTKDDNISNSLNSETTGKRETTGKILPTLSLKKQLRKKNVFKTDLLSLSNNNTELSTPSTLCMSKAKGQVGHLKNIKGMKTTRIPVDCTNDLMKTQQTQEVIKNVNVNISSDSTKIFERSRNSLTRVAKSRHLFLSKININKEKNENPVVLKKLINTVNKNTTKISTKKNKPKEIKSIKTTVLKKTKMNTHILQPNTLNKNDSCFICGKGHTELKCKNIKCPRVFHLSCMNKTRIVKSGFICPSHFCSVCKKRKVVAKCKLCVESFCTTHVKGNIFKDPLGNGMLCTTHYSDKKSLHIASSSSVNSKLIVTNSNTESVNFSGSNLGTAPAEDLPDYDEDQLNIDEMNAEEYNLTQVVKDECNREYIHIGGFNVCTTSDLVTDQEESYTSPVNTDGDLFKPSSANIVFDIESASALYQPSDFLQLESIATENKDSHDYVNVHFIPDASQTKNKWLAAEP